MNVKGIEDPVQRQSMVDQIHHFGQVPVQLFTTSHPIRKKKNVNTKSACLNVMTTTFDVLQDPVFCGSIGLNQWILIDSKGQIQSVVLKDQEKSGSKITQLNLDLRYENGLNQKLIALYGKMVCIAGTWDNAISIFQIDHPQSIERVVGHSDKITCLAIDDMLLVSGSVDTSVLVWKLTRKDLSACIIKMIAYVFK